MIRLEKFVRDTHSILLLPSVYYNEIYVLQIRPQNLCNTLNCKLRRRKCFIMVTLETNEAVVLKNYRRIMVS
jgi:hypothetical protein